MLHGIDLVLAPGEFAALVGPSGSGKSTLLNLIGLLEPPTAGPTGSRAARPPTLTEGEVTALRATHLGFVFQFHHLLPAFTATENVLMPGLIARRADNRPRAANPRAQLLRDVGLGDRLDYPPRKLSGGQQQRVAIARALSLSSPLVLADEPTGNLDTHVGRRHLRADAPLQPRSGTAFLIVTHDPRLARRCDRIVELIDGRVASDRANDAAATPSV